MAKWVRQSWELTVQSEALAFYALQEGAGEHPICVCDQHAYEAESWKAYGETFHAAVANDFQHGPLIQVKL